MKTFDEIIKEIQTLTGTLSHERLTGRESNQIRAKINLLVKEAVKVALERACEVAEAEMEHVPYDDDRPVVSKESIMNVLKEMEG